MSGSIGRLSLAWALVLGPGHAQSATEKVVHTFSYFAQGANPYAPLALDAAGNLYGTTYSGGARDLGAVFEIPAGGGYKVLYGFKGGTDGANPYSGVTVDPSGNMYGTTYHGGAANAGVVYKIDPSGHESLLYTFKGGSDGCAPYAGVTLDSAGNLYGTAYGCGMSGHGTVYKIAASGQVTVLHSFGSQADDGSNPYAGVALDSAGNLYGTTYNGGRLPHGVVGNGVVYKLSPAGQETVLYTFLNSTIGGSPYAGVILDSSGNLYGANQAWVYELTAAGQYIALYRLLSAPEGNLTRDTAGNLYFTTERGGTAGAGAVYKLDTTGTLTTLYCFPGGGLLQAGPNPGVILDSAGDLYGVTPYANQAGMAYKVSSSGQATTLHSFSAAPGGTYPGPAALGPGGYIYGATAQGGAANAGLVYKLDGAGHETVLYTFTGGADGAGPSTDQALALDSAGNLYGAAASGGIAAGNAGYGVVFEINSSGHESVLYTFNGGADGTAPVGVVRDQAGNLYGTTTAGGAAGLGVVFKIDTSGQETVLHTFIGGGDGAEPGGGVVMDGAGNIYGVTFVGGAFNYGVIYMVDASGQERVLHSFTGFGSGGGNPLGALLLDSAGNLYGTTSNFGTTSSGGAGAGVVYELSAADTYTVLYTFTGGADGASPDCGVARDSAGNLYGANASGGDQRCFGGYGCGVVYQLNQSGQLTVLHSFTGGADGGGSGAVTLGPSATLFGPAGGGTAGGGLIYQLTLP